MSESYLNVDINADLKESQQERIHGRFASVYRYIHWHTRFYQSIDPWGENHNR